MSFVPFVLLEDKKPKMSDIGEDAVYKIVVLGAGGVGKSAITIRFINGQFLEEYDPTIEDSYHKKSEVEYGDNQKEAVTFSILDTAGQDEYKALQETWVRESQYFLLVYSIENRQTFDQVHDFLKIIARAHEVNEEPIFVCLAGNKCDMREGGADQTKLVSMADGQKLADDLPKIMAEARGIDTSDTNTLQQLDHMVRRRFLETSAKTGTNITQAFHDLVKMRKKFDYDETNKKNTTSSGGGGCCTLL